MDSLLPINQIAKLAKTDKIHLAYMTKLRLIPQTIRRKVNGKITGCYPESVIQELTQIEELKNHGLTYSQIRYQLDSRQNDGPVATTTPNFAIAFLVVGLILGYLLANGNNLNMSSTNVAAKNVTLPAESDYQKVLRLAGNQNTNNQPIYVIAVPNQNIDRLGKVNFNELIKQL